MNPKNTLRILLGVVLVLTLTIAWTQRDQIDFALIETWLSQAGWIAPALFILVYAFATVAFFPALILTLLGGALFGPWRGALFNLTDNWGQIRMALT